MYLTLKRKYSRYFQIKECSCVLLAKTHLYGKRPETKIHPLKPSTCACSRFVSVYFAASTTSAWCILAIELNTC